MVIDLPRPVAALGEAVFDLLRRKSAELTLEEAAFQSVRPRGAPTPAQLPVLDLFADAPALRPRAAAYLLAAYVAEFPAGSVFLCVVDPGVGTGQRQPAVVEADSSFPTSYPL